MEIIDKSFIRAPRGFLVQSLLAVIVMAVILIFVQVLTHAAIVAALGASTFIVFVMPHSLTAQTRNLVGGHIIGLACGAFCYYAFLVGPLGEILGNWDNSLCCISAIAVGLSIFLMTVTNTEHPPAASTALGVVVHEWSLQIILFVLTCAICLAIVRRLLRGYLKDLV